jgi:hypothetical protein
VLRHDQFVDCLPIGDWHKCRGRYIPWRSRSRCQSGGFEIQPYFPWLLLQRILLQNSPVKVPRHGALWTAWGFNGSRRKVSLSTHHDIDICANEGKCELRRLSLNICLLLSDGPKRSKAGLKLSLSNDWISTLRGCDRPVGFACGLNFARYCKLF